MTLHELLDHLLPYILLEQILHQHCQMEHLAIMGSEQEGVLFGEEGEQVVLERVDGGLEEWVLEGEGEEVGVLALLLRYIA